jgi:hypothetical protein
VEYGIVTGTGRSGTNWLLDMLDASPRTHCRNEPHGLKGTPMNRFPLVWTSDRAGSVELYRERWDEVATGTARRLGVRDHHFRYHKPYLYPWSNHLRLSRVLTGPRARSLTSVVDHRLAGREFELPGWLGSRRRLEDSLGVLKIVLDAPLLSWLLAERPPVPVVHIVRHPGGRLHSWLTRLLGPMSNAERVTLRDARRGRLERIRAFDERWRTLIPEPSSLPLIKMELWFWRYVNETTMEAGQGHDGYLLLRFDDVAKEPERQAELLYRHMGLPWTDEVRRRVVADTSRSVFGAVSDSRGVADAWRTELEREHVDAIEEVVSGSPLAQVLA